MKQKIKHIVFLTPGFATSENDSTTIPALQVYLKSVKNQFPEIKLTVISFQFPFTNKTYFWNGIEIHPLNGRNSKGKKISIWKKAYSYLNKINTEFPIDIVHSFWIGECSFIGQFWTSKNKRKHIVTAMGQDVFKNKFALFFNKNQTKIVTLSKNHHAELFQNYKLKSEIIPWGIDTNSFPAIQENSIDILGVGSLNKVKNYPLFIEIIKEIVKEHSNLKVEIAGKGNEQHQIEKLIAKHKLENNTKLLGEVSRNIILEKMSKSKILLHTSNFESFGYVFTEALYSGMFIISKNIGIAQTLPEWKIATSKNDFISGTISLLKESKPKNRVLLHATEDVINSYFNLYNA